MTPAPNFTAVPGVFPHPLPTGTEGFGNDLGWVALKMFLGLGVVCLLAIVLLRVVAPMLTGKANAAASQMRILGRLNLEGRRSLLLVRVLNRTFLLGSTDGGISLVAELDDGQLIGPQPLGPVSIPFLDIFRKKRKLSAEENLDGQA